MAGLVLAALGGDVADHTLVAHRGQRILSCPVQHVLLLRRKVSVILFSHSD